MNLNTSVSSHTNTVVIPSSTSPAVTPTSTVGQITTTSVSTTTNTVGVGNGITIAEQPQSQHHANNKQITINGKIARSASNVSSENGGAFPVTTDNKNSDSKRKKSKARSSANIPKNQIYSRNHLDSWLESCLKDSTTPQLSSSSEFLDYNQSSFNAINKKPPIQNQFFTTKTNYPAPFSQGFQKSVTENQNLISNPFYFNNFMKNTMLNDGSVEFASLPPIVNLSNIDENNILDNNIDGNDRKFSDPCLLNPSDNESKMSGQNTPNRQNFHNETGNSNNNKLFITLMEQINLLHETNSKICRNLQDTKIDIEALKNSPNWGLRHRRDSLSGLSTHSQPMGFAFGTQSPAPTYHSGMYTPGMMTDVVREVKEAARVREDALLSRVKSMVEERSWSLGEGNLRMMRDIEELKAQIQHLRSDRKESNKRMSQLEAENKYLKQLLTTLLNNKSSENVHEHEFLRSTPINKKNNTESVKIANKNGNRPRRHNSFNLHYGVINQNDESFLLNPLVSNDKKSISLIENNQNIGNTNSRNLRQNSTTHNLQSPLHHQSGYIDSQLRIIENQFTNNSALSTDNNDDDDDNDKNDGDNNSQLNAVQLEKDKIELRRELQDALASKTDAENRIIALEKIVRNLQVKDDKQQFSKNYLIGKKKVDNGNGNNSITDLILNKENPSLRAQGQNVFTNGSFTINQQQSLQRQSNKDFGIPQNFNTNINHITSQMQGLTSKFSLAGPITDL